MQHQRGIFPHVRQEFMRLVTADNQSTPLDSRSADFHLFFFQQTLSGRQLSYENQAALGYVGMTQRKGINYKSIRNYSNIEDRVK